VIPDSHIPLVGLHPVLFSIGGMAVTSYAFFMVLGIVAAIGWFRHQSRLEGPADPHSWTIILSALFFGSLGAKLMAVALSAGRYPSFGVIQFLYAGRSIVGGLIGGWFGVKLVKRVLGIHTRHGNAIAPAAALGLAVGRLGCLLGSCCYGKPTTGLIAVDFGDGQRRHPTQLYEALFDLALFAWLVRANRRHPPPGRLFRHFLFAYFSFRFFIEFIRAEPVVWLGLTVYQWFSLAVVAAGLAAAVIHRGARTLLPMVGRPLRGRRQIEKRHT